jgi:hypothetical protein
MSNGNDIDLRNLAAFPSAIEHLSRAGSAKEQITLYDTAWCMLEAYSLPDGYRGSRFANAWLGERNWRVQIAPQRELWKPEQVAALAKAARQRGHEVLYGAGLPAGEGYRSAVWRVPSDAEDISRFFESHYAVFHLLFPKDLSFAVHGWDGDLATFTGPETFLRDVLAPEDIGPDATAAAIAYMNPSLTVEDFAGDLEPYQPFMLD